MLFTRHLLTFAINLLVLKLRIAAKTLKQVFWRLIFITGVVATVMMALSFTDLPWHAYYHLGTSQIDRKTEADFIVVLGAGAVPGHHSLLRCWYAAKASEQLPEAKVIVALPADSLATNTDHDRMIDELIFRGIDKRKIFSEKAGRNTHAQAVNIRRMIVRPDARILLITSPEHMFRSIKTFRKAGFVSLNGIPTFEAAFNNDLLVEKESDGKRIRLVEQNLNLRYNMWSYLQYQIIVLREYAAIIWYQLKGYI